jgi:hypothetical protein
MEREIFESFSFIFRGEAPSILRIDDTCETPDFILCTTDWNISIEHTRFVHERRWELQEFRRRLISKAKLKFKSIFEDKVCIHFS